MAFRALLLREQDGKVTATTEALDEAQLPDGDVLIDVEYSSLNYKDGLILRGLGRLVKNYPHVPGIDLAGTVAQSDAARFKPGDKVVLTGWRVGELSWGGYAQKARVKSSQLVKLAPTMTTQQAMAIGTAGFTAMLCVMALEQHGLAKNAAVLVTGAGGGVGSVAVALLAQLGYRVTAASGRAANADYLRRLGAHDVVDRAAFADGPKKPLDSEKWNGAVDTVGGKTLAAVISQLAYRASVAACGLVGGNDLPSSVVPFLLRGVNLLGIDSVMSPLAERERAWMRLTTDLPIHLLESLTQVATLDDLPRLAGEILAGATRGRVVIDVRA